MLLTEHVPLATDARTLDHVTVRLVHLVLARLSAMLVKLSSLRFATQLEHLLLQRLCPCDRLLPEAAAVVTALHQVVFEFEDRGHASKHLVQLLAQRVCEVDRGAEESVSTEKVDAWVEKRLSDSGARRADAPIDLFTWLYVMKRSPDAVIGQSIRQVMLAISVREDDNAA